MIMPLSRKYMVWLLLALATASTLGFAQTQTGEQSEVTPPISVEETANPDVGPGTQEDSESVPATPMQFVPPGTGSPTPVPPNPFIPLDIQQVPGVELTTPSQIGIAAPSLIVEESIQVAPVESSMSVAPALTVPSQQVVSGLSDLRVLAGANPENPLAVWAQEHEVRYGGLAVGQVGVAVFQSKEGYFTLPEGWTVPGQDILVESVEPGRVVLAQGPYRLALGSR